MYVSGCMAEWNKYFSLPCLFKEANILHENYWQFSSPKYKMIIPLLRVLVNIIWVIKFTVLICECKWKTAIQISVCLVAFFMCWLLKYIFAVTPNVIKFTIDVLSMWFYRITWSTNRKLTNMKYCFNMLLNTQIKLWSNISSLLRV